MTGYRTIAATTFALIATVFMPEPASSFVLRPPAQISTRLYLEDWVADLIDKELYRQGHREEFEAEWMEKNRAAVLHKVESDFGPLDDLDDSDFRMYQKDKNMAVRDPEKYCADRCIATGNCEVFQDFYEMGPEDVIKFCTECVLNQDEDAECELPKGFYDGPTP